MNTNPKRTAKPKAPNEDQLTLADQIKIEIPKGTPPEFVPWIRLAWSIMWGLQ